MAVPCIGSWSLTPIPGSALTFSQMLFITVHSLPSFLTFSNSAYLPRLKPRQVPLARWALQVLVLTAGSLLNNWAFQYNVPLTILIVFRSGGEWCSSYHLESYNFYRSSHIHAVWVSLLSKEIQLNANCQCNHSTLPKEESQTLVHRCPLWSWLQASFWWHYPGRQRRMTQGSQYSYPQRMRESIFWGSSWWLYHLSVRGSLELCKKGRTRSMVPVGGKVYSIRCVTNSNRLHCTYALICV